MLKQSHNSYSDMRLELDEILDELQAGNLDVEAAATLYERGLELIKQLENYLESAENKIQKLQNRSEPE